ncbi:hypothetical protein M153_13700010102 [Pseudoloma neurophilia]|uniref:Uncharacterized protein n=1 Tax=Pseudoloma neurophilia TaxID=146866 RepID=A0A0R0M5X9_9MICR|nr:hypothetical protein M153_13700010102 [Pseudoloma neurophilia]
MKEDHISLDHDLDINIINRPKIIIFYVNDDKIFNKNRKQYLTIKRSNGNVYNLKGIVHYKKGEKEHFNSYFIKNGKVYDQKSGLHQSLTTANFINVEFLIYELEESE